jgi:O-antigen/teichoic acid export membrane protein
VVRAALGSGRVGGAIARTACFNVAAAGAAAMGGLILARTFGPTVRGEYAAVTSWFGIVLAVGEVGQMAAVCYYVASDPRRARGYVATSRAILLVTGSVALVCGLAAAPLLSHGDATLAAAYRLIFSGTVIFFIGVSYTASLQARSTERWNLVRVSQPVLALLATIALWGLGLLTLYTAIVTLLVTMTIQLGYAYLWCRRSRLAPGRARAALIRPLAVYGVTQLSAGAPASVNTYLDQLVLSQVVPPADLGRYAVAVSATLVPVPLVSAISNVVFPRLAAQRTAARQSRRLQRAAMATSAAIASAVLLPIGALAYWLIPLVFGPSYRAAVPLVWILVPGGIFLACSQVAGFLLSGLGRPGLVAAAEGIAAVCTVTMLIALVPAIGVAGAAIASTVAYGVALAVKVRFLRQSFHRHRRQAGRAQHRKRKPPGSNRHGKPLQSRVWQ